MIVLFEPIDTVAVVNVNGDNHLRTGLGRRQPNQYAALRAGRDRVNLSGRYDYPRFCVLVVKELLESARRQLR